MQVYCDIYPVYDICVQYVMPVRYNNRWRIVVGTQQQKRAQARNTCVYVRRAWENVFDFCLVFFFNQNFAHLYCNNCISIEDEAQRRLLSTLNSALGYILVYQVHWLLRQKKRNLFVRLQLTSVSMPIRDTLFTQSLAHTHTQNTYRLTHTFTYGISWLLRWKMDRYDRSWDVATAPINGKSKKWNQNQLSNLRWKFSDCVYVFFCWIFFRCFFFFSLSSFFFVCTEHEHLQMRCHKNTFTFTYQKIDGKMIP